MLKSLTEVKKKKASIRLLNMRKANLCSGFLPSIHFQEHKVERYKLSTFPNATTFILTVQPGILCGPAAEQ